MLARGRGGGEEAAIPEENLRVQAGDQNALSHATSASHGNRTHLAAVTDKRVHCPNLDTRTQMQSLYF